MAKFEIEKHYFLSFIIKHTPKTDQKKIKSGIFYDCLFWA